MYMIKVSYRTGNTFGSYDEDDYIGGREWKNLEVVAENLERIKLHNEWYEGKHNTWADSKPEKPVFVSDEYDFVFKLLDDDKTEFDVHANWCGYFESLYGASVEFNMGFKR